MGRRRMATGSYVRPIRASLCVYRVRGRDAQMRAAIRVGHDGGAGERRNYAFLSRGWAARVGYSPLTRKTPPEGATTRRAGAPATKASLGSFRETREEIRCNTSKRP